MTQLDDETSMSETTRIKTVLLLCTYWCLILLALITALNGVLGRDAQELAVGGALALAVFFLTSLVGLVILGDWPRARSYVHRRKALSASCEDHLAVCGIDADADKLRTTVELMQRDEDSYTERYAQRRCSAEDVIRAKALRVKAEIELIRHEKRPKSWSEVCAVRERDVRSH